MKIKNKLKKAALAMAVLTNSPGNAAGTDIVTCDNTTAPMHQTIDSNVRTVSGVLIQERYTDVYIMNSDKQYKVYYLDTNNDFLEDYICVQIISQDKARYDYAPGTIMNITEIRDNNGKWFVSKIDTQKTRKILPPEKSR